MNRYRISYCRNTYMYDHGKFYLWKATLKQGDPSCKNSGANVALMLSGSLPYVLNVCTRKHFTKWPADSKHKNSNFANRQFTQNAKSKHDTEATSTSSLLLSCVRRRNTHTHTHRTTTVTLAVHAHRGFHV